MSNLEFYINAVLMAGLLPFHLRMGVPAGRGIAQKLLLGMVCAWLLYAFYLAFLPHVHLRDVILALGAYSVALFVLISEILMVGGARWLTKKRGALWAKEIDYVYLTIGAVGVFLSIGKLQNVTDKVVLPPLFAPLLVSTAIVLRAIKTRVEIGAWNTMTGSKPK